MKIIEKEFNVITGEETISERDETVIEKKARETFEKQLIKEQAEAEAKQVAREAIAQRLGLTLDELKLLFG